jgi:hypothetical protein
MAGNLASGLALGGGKRSGTGSSSGNNPSNTGGQQQWRDRRAAGREPGSSNTGGHEPGGQNQAGTQGDAPEPTSTVSGQASAESDRGSPTAVAHRCVSQPGAPAGPHAQPGVPLKSRRPRRRSTSRLPPFQRPRRYNTSTPRFGSAPLSVSAQRGIWICSQLRAVPCRLRAALFARFRSLPSSLPWLPLCRPHPPARL